MQLSTMYLALYFHVQNQLFPNLIHIKNINGKVIYLCSVFTAWHFMTLHTAVKKEQGQTIIGLC